ncbi:LexA family protein [Frederiksenia canicola]|uniref:SOS-response transcriptional repressor LexA n=1 Tax=Frederiksenia canicola TaxID=123824 RepID=A0AAE7C312_9PAST|nr:LexA family transcriptional regulator [Frederiksenia canicola]QIM65238.1 hypothetical protein A4G17_07210 [Frederiksenia canicola]RPE96334.1 SOS-response transcriptional repressor LexA [Frederiksenia canicola]
MSSTESTLAMRLKEAMNKENVSIQELSNAVGITYEMARRYVMGSAKPREKRLNLIAEFLKVTPMWLQFGEKSNVVPVNVTKANKYPLVSAVQAGSFTEACDYKDVDGYKEIDSEIETKGDGFYLEIKGDSMEPKFLEGDLVLVDTGLSPYPGCYVVAVNGSGEATLKKYKELNEISESGNQHFELIPLNPEWKSRIINSKTQEVRIIGVAVEHRSYL